MKKIAVLLSGSGVFDGSEIHEAVCSGQLKLATILEFNQNNRSDSLGVSPPLY